MKMEFREPEIKYVTEKGRRQAVIVALKDYERLLRALEDLRDIQSAERRRNEPSFEYRPTERNALRATNHPTDVFARDL